MRMSAINLKSKEDRVNNLVADNIYDLYSHCEDAEAVHRQLGEVDDAESVQSPEAALGLPEVARPELVQVPGAGVAVAVDHRALALARQTQARALRW